MIFFKRCALIIFFSIFAVFRPLCAAADERQISAQPVSVMDFRGRTISLDAPAKRVVCLIESALSGIYMLGAQNSVIAISTNIYQESVNRYYAAMDDRIARKQLPSPGNWDFVSIERIVALRPDLVVIWASQTEAIAAMEEKGIAVYGVELATFDDIFREIDDFGKLFHRRKRAADLIDYARGELAMLSGAVSRIADAHRPGVYFMWAQGELETSGAPSTVNDVIEMAGGRNVCGHIRQEHTVVNLENLIAWRPDVIVMWHNPRKSPQDIISMPVWQSLPASKNRRVHELPSVFFCDLWTLKCLHAVKLIAGWCHPQAFGTFQLDSEKRSMLCDLYGKEIGERIPLEE